MTRAGGDPKAATGRGADLAWARLEAAADEALAQPLHEKFAEDDDRLERLSANVAGLYFDFSKTHLGETLVGGFAELAESGGLQRMAGAAPDRS